MYSNIDEITALFNAEAESVALEFKSGRTFQELSSDVRREFVKDVTAFANASGGTIIIGVAEARDGQRNLASAFEPVTNQRVSADQLTSILKSNTDPVFSDFRVIPLEVPGGRVFVIEIEQADTAHQNRLDQRYYQRTGPISEPMYDFAIRDVMNRRKAPRLAVALTVQNIRRGAEVHRYRVLPRLTNEGTLTAHHWTLKLSVPASIADLRQQANFIVTPGPNFRHAGVDYTPFEYSSERLTAGMNGLRLLPGQELVLSVNAGFSELDLEVDAERFHRDLENLEPALQWSLFLDDAPRKDGELPFNDWCSF
ncbi:helix-turn-helix domain-containing protein [Caballeronia novacaledonica]|uniref:ATP-binding protein n=1 Tax=Caballeronia novacaledonica TaxID=1544861 RepID=A0AA37IBP6_9BURK|nr:ATP-binding protein [Caballeronia novacaledonica]GJH23696.1 ATP-binding protein [Caballeronia novacaledonica]